MKMSYDVKQHALVPMTWLVLCKPRVGGRWTLAATRRTREEATRYSRLLSDLNTLLPE